MENQIKFWKVGGCVRDSFIGRESKDIDYSVEAPSFEAMREEILARGGRIFQEKPQFFTISAMIGFESSDYVLARKDGVYGDGRHPDSVDVGSILDDLTRRDFTMNAIAQNPESGDIFDPFGGVQDINARIIRCVGNTWDRMTEDWNRVLRAIRFMIVLGFDVTPEIAQLFDNERAIEGIIRTVSHDRIRGEVGKMFKADSLASIRFFANHDKLAEAIFQGEMWLKATDEKKK